MTHLEELPHPAARIEVCPHGPLLVRGDFEVVDAEGNRVTSRSTVALCRCGASHIKPMCDGSHKRTRFDQPPRDPRIGAAEAD